MASALAGNGCLLGTQADEATPADAGADQGAPPSQNDTAVVERVIDGDTLDLVFGQQVERVRLIGIDAPESVARDVPVHCYGAEASAALHDLLPAGTEVTVTRDVEARDRYDRLLLYVHRAADGLFVNEWLVAEGYAEARSYQPNVAHQNELDRAREAARRAEVGLWGRCDGPEQPLD